MAKFCRRVIFLLVGGREVFFQLAGNFFKQGGIFSAGNFWWEEIGGNGIFF